MKRHLLLYLTMCAILAAAIYGHSKRKTYTDLSGAADYLDQLQVAELPEQFAVGSCEELSKVLPDSPIILRVAAVGDIEHLFMASRQLVSVKEVYAGSGMLAGQDIYLISNHWRLSLDHNPDSIERGFVNIMKIGAEYLVFIVRRVEGLCEPVPIYELYDDSFIAPIFCYEELDNEIIKTEGQTTYVPYYMVKNNEFFAETEQGLRAWEKLKSEMLARYPDFTEY